MRINIYYVVINTIIKVVAQMKKYFRFLVCLLALSIVIFNFPFKAYAKSSELSIPNFDIKTVVNSDGSINMEELITFDFDGNFNGAYRDISTNKTGGVENINVSLIQDGQAEKFKKVDSAKNGQNGVYQILNQDSNIKRIKIFCPSDDKKRTFKITYAMKNVAVKYSDIGDFYYTYWSGTNEVKIDHMNINIILPQNTGRNNIKTFYHGILNGVASVNDSSVNYSFSGIGSNTLVETRVLFPANLIASSKNVKNENAEERILSEEKDYQVQRQKKIAAINERKKIFNIISLIVSAVLILLMIETSFKYKRDEEGINSTYIPPDIPEDCTPAVASYFVSNTLNGKTIYATILDLWRKGYINVEKDDKEFTIVKKRDSDISLLEHERFFMNWIFNKMGNGESITSSEIKKSCKKSNSYYDYQNWVKLVKEECKKRKYYDTDANHAGAAEVVISLIGIFFSFVSLASSAYWGGLLIALSIMLFIHGMIYALRKSDIGLEKFNKWIKFKSYIKNLDVNFESSVNSKIIESYIPYAEALSLSKDDMINLRSSFANPNASMGWIYYYLLFDNISLGRNDRFSSMVYTSFGTGSSGTGGTYSSSGSSPSGGGAGGGGAGGF